MLARLKMLTIAQKASLVFVLLIALPATLLSIYIYLGYFNHLYSRGYSDRRTAMNQLAGNMEATLLSADSLAKDLAYRSSLSSLLRKSNLGKFPIYSKTYMNQITTAIQYAMKYQNLDINSICIFSSNPTLKEDQGIFFSVSRIAPLPFYMQFMDMDTTYALYLLDDEEAMAYTAAKYGKPSSKRSLAIYLTAIIDPITDERLGALAMEFYPEHLFKPVIESNQNGGGYFVMLENSGKAFGGKLNPHLSALLLNSRSTTQTVSIKGRQYFYNTNKKFGFIVSSTEHINRMDYMAAALSSSSLLLIVTVIQLAVLTRFTKYLFSKLNKNLNEMDRIVLNGFEGSIPINGTDEIEQLSVRYNTLLKKINWLVKDAVIKDTSEKTAQLKSLQYQINPHFIYNTLGVFAGNAEKKENYELSEAISYFGQMLRYNIKNDGLESTVGREIDNARSLFAIYSMKHPGKLSIRINADRQLRQTKMMKFLLQPLLENSVMHGRKNHGHFLQIVISVFCDAEHLTIEVWDNGIGISKDRLGALLNSFDSGETAEPARDSHSSFIGLRNINDRIKLFYGEQAGIHIDSNENEFTKVTVRIPCL